MNKNRKEKFNEDEYVVLETNVPGEGPSKLRRSTWRPRGDNQYFLPAPIRRYIDGA